MNTAVIGAARSAARAGFPGLLVSAIVAVSAVFLSEHYHASAMLFALLVGMALNFLSLEGRCIPGIRFASSTVLRVGVALLGLRITVAQVAGLGGWVVALVVASVILTILAGIAFGRALGQGNRFGVLTGGAVAICGASAALAIASVLPHTENAERDTSFAVIGVTTLSTLAMVVYPIVVAAFGLDHHDSGVFLGATIHDVAQVVGAGYGISTETGDTATVVKLMRVAMLLPVVFAISLVTHLKSAGGAARAPLLPWFAVAFAAFVAVNSMGWIAPGVQDAAGDVSRWCLVIAISAIGMKTQLKDLAVMGIRPIAMMVAETVFLAGLVLGAMLLR